MVQSKMVHSYSFMSLEEVPVNQHYLYTYKGVSFMHGPCKKEKYLLSPDNKNDSIDKTICMKIKSKYLRTKHTFILKSVDNLKIRMKCSKR